MKRLILAQAILLATTFYTIHTRWSLFGVAVGLAGMAAAIAIMWVTFPRRRD